MSSKLDYLELLTDEPYILGHMLGFTELTELHNDWIKSIVLSKNDFTLLAHRGSYKTTCLTIGLAIILILEPNSTTIFLRKTDVDVKEVINQIYKLSNSNLMKHIVKKIYDGRELVFTTATAFALDTNLKTTNKGANQIIGMGIKTSITGKHADRVITDDIVNLKDRISGAERETTKLAYMELQNIRNRGGVIINTGTTWHKDDCISIMANKRVYDCYSTGLISREKLEEIRQTMTPSLFSANYELKHIADEECLFSNPKFTKDVESIFNGVAHIDASYGGGDYTAFTILKKTDSGYIVFGKRWEKHVDDCINEIMQYMTMYRAGTIYNEKNADKGYLAKELRGKGLAVGQYNETMNKFIKISTYLRKSWSEILFLEDTDPNYINDILDYTENAVHDDSPDSLASLIRQLDKSKWLF